MLAQPVLETVFAGEIEALEKLARGDTRLSRGQRVDVELSQIEPHCLPLGDKRRLLSDIEVLAQMGQFAAKAALSLCPVALSPQLFQEPAAGPLAAFRHGKHGQDGYGLPAGDVESLTLRSEQSERSHQVQRKPVACGGHSPPKSTPSFGTLSRPKVRVDARGNHDWRTLTSRFDSGRWRHSVPAGTAHRRCIPIRDGDSRRALPR